MARPLLIDGPAAVLAIKLARDDGLSVSAIAEELAHSVGQVVSTRTVQRFLEREGVRAGDSSIARRVTVTRSTCVAQDPDVGSALVQRFMSFLGHLDRLAAGATSSDREQRLSAEAGAQQTLLAMIEFGVRVTEEAEESEGD